MASLRPILPFLFKGHEVSGSMASSELAWVPGCRLHPLFVILMQGLFRSHHFANNVYAWYDIERWLVGRRILLARWIEEKTATWLTTRFGFLLVFLAFLGWSLNIQYCVIHLFRRVSIYLYCIQVNLHLSSTCSQRSSSVHVVEVHLILRLHEDGVHVPTRSVRGLMAWNAASVRFSRSISLESAPSPGWIMLLNCLLSLLSALARNKNLRRSGFLLVLRWGGLALLEHLSYVLKHSMTLLGIISLSVWSGR